MSTSEAAERLHLNPQTLEALEAGRMEALGAAVYARGHLKRYAELVGVAESEILAAYDAWSGRPAALPDLREVITAPAVRSGTRRFELKAGHALTGAIVLVLVMVVWWAMRKPSRVSERAVPAAAVQSAAPAPAAPTLTPSSIPAPTPAAPPPAPAPPVAATVRPVAPSSAQSRPPPVAVSAPLVNAPAVSAPATVSVSGPPARLALNFSENSWIEIYGADGAQLFHGMAQAGSQHRVTGIAPLRVFLGNPPAVTLEMNGHPVVMTGNPKPRRFSLDDAGHIVEVRASDTSAKGPTAQPRSD
jgi:cytoskeleton protein RodZ